MLLQETGDRIQEFRRMLLQETGDGRQEFRRMLLQETGDGRQEFRRMLFRGWRWEFCQKFLLEAGSAKAH